MAGILVGRRRDKIGSQLHFQAEDRPLRSAACEPTALIDVVAIANTVEPHRLCSRVGCFQRWPRDLASSVGVSMGGGS